MTDQPVRAFLGLGSNLGDRRRHLRTAVASLDDVVGVSPVYETEPVGGPEQGAFLNIVVEVATRRTPVGLLEECRRLERQAQRVRSDRWGPRTLDVDIIWIDGFTSDRPDLTVPHPRAHERGFVMVPLLDLEPALRLPGYEAAQTVGEVRRLGPL